MSLDATFTEAFGQAGSVLDIDSAHCQPLPHSTESFDFVRCIGTFEHARNAYFQMGVIAEARRVARKGVFIVTRNRWFPSRRQNLHLISARELHGMVRFLNLHDAYEVRRLKRYGLTSHLIFILHKGRRAPMK